MTSLPVLRRELQVAARRPGTFGVRFIGAILATLLGGLFLAGAALPTQSPATSGHMLFVALISLAHILTLLAGPLLTAPSISGEKRQGTLGLLFLTDLGGWDVVTGKLGALALVPLHGLLATLPIAAVTFCLGGVVSGELVRAYLVLLNTLFLSLTLGLWVSSRTSDERQALGLTLGAVVLIAAVPEFAARLLASLANIGSAGPWGLRLNSDLWVLLSPTGLLRHSLATRYAAEPSAFWWAILGHHAAAWFFLIGAGIWVKRFWREPMEEARPQRESSRAGAGARLVRRVQRAHRRRLQDEGPLAWHAWRSGAIRLGIFWVVLLTALAVVATFLVLGPHTPRTHPGATASTVLTVGFAVLKILLSIHTAYFLSDACRTGALELVLVTPVSSRRLCDSHLAAMRSVCVWPFVVLAALQVAAGVTDKVLAGGDWPSPLMMITAGAMPALFACLTHGLELLAVTYHTSRWALTYDRPVKAIARTVVLVLILPGVLCYNGRFLVDLIIIGQTRPVLERFRDLARSWFFPGPVAASFGAPKST